MTNNNNEPKPKLPRRQFFKRAGELAVGTVKFVAKAGTTLGAAGTLLAKGVEDRSASLSEELPDNISNETKLALRRSLVESEQGGEKLLGYASKTAVASGAAYAGIRAVENRFDPSKKWTRRMALTEPAVAAAELLVAGAVAKSVYNSGESIAATLPGKFTKRLGSEETVRLKIWEHEKVTEAQHSLDDNTMMGFAAFGMYYLSRLFGRNSGGQSR